MKSKQILFVSGNNGVSPDLYIWELTQTKGLFIYLSTLIASERRNSTEVASRILQAKTFPDDEIGTNK